MIALVDVNSMFASCETIFCPDLKGRPVYVLSNNDGYVIARSAAAKKLVKMGPMIERGAIGIHTSLLSAFLIPLK